ncbi:MAG TPA: hypothetical protein PLV12_11025, partial [Saprospiraceae bacterium]|nr:hypothetical protein [Saprospiraceae bacterium]
MVGMTFERPARFVIKIMPEISIFPLITLNEGNNPKSVIRKLLEIVKSPKIDSSFGNAGTLIS